MKLLSYYSTLLVLALALIIADLTAVSAKIDFDSHLIATKTDHLIDYCLLVSIALS